MTVIFQRAFQPSAGLSHWKIGTRQTCMKWLLISVNSVNSYSAVLPPSPMVFFSLLSHFVEWQTYPVIWIEQKKLPNLEEGTCLFTEKLVASSQRVFVLWGPLRNFGDARLTWVDFEGTHLLCHPSQSFATNRIHQESAKSIWREIQQFCKITLAFSSQVLKNI